MTTQIPLQAPLTRLWDIVVSIEKNGQVLDRYRHPIGIALPPPDRDFAITAPIPEPALVRFFKHQLGVDTTFGPHEWLVRENFDFSSGAWSDPLGVSPTPGARLVPREREPCLSSVEFRLKAIRDARRKAERFRVLGITDYMVADECPLGGRCFAPATIGQFRRVLKNMYGSLTNLNREWQTDVASWEDVVPLANPNHTHPGSYVDFNWFHRRAFAEYCSFLEMLMGDTIPGFKAGHSGGVRGNLMMHYAGALYYYDVIESAVSVKRPDAVIGSWYRPGYRFIETHETTSRAWPWRHLFRGTTRIQIWYPTGGGAPAWHEDLSRPYNAFVWLNEEMNDIRRGIGKLLLHCDRDDGPVAVYTSQRTQLVINALDEIQGLQTEEQQSTVQRPGRVPESIPERTLNILQRQVLEHQVECRFISEYLVENGELEARQTKLLIMPRVVSLSDVERRKIRHVLNRGGTVVAFEETGTRNEHGTWVGDAFMQDVFGVRLAPGAVEERSASLQLDTASATSTLPSLSAAGLFPVTLAAAAVENLDGDVICALDGHPVIVRKQHGRGTAMFVNFMFSESAAGHEKSPSPQNRLMRDLLAAAGIRPDVLVTQDDERVHDLQFGQFRDGDAVYAGFLIPGQGGMLDQEQGRAVTVQFPSPRHMYDARGGRYLGHRKTVETMVMPSVAHVYAALPWKLLALEVKPQTDPVIPGQRLPVQLIANTEQGPPSRQVWNVSITQPDGTEAHAHSRTLLIQDGQAEIGVPIALNASPGKWTIRVRDAATGVMGTGTFTVEAGPDNSSQSQEKKNPVVPAVTNDKD